MLDPSILTGASTIPTAIGIGDGDTTGPTDDQALREIQLAQLELNQLKQDQQNARILAVALEIQSAMDAWVDADAAANFATQQLADALPGYQIQIAWRKQASAVCSLLADSDPAQTPSTMWAAAAEEIAYRNAATVFPPVEMNNQQALLAVAQFCRSLQKEDRCDDSSSGPTIIGVPLVDHHGSNCGALLAISKANTAVARQFCGAQLQAISVGLANKLVALQANQPSELESLVRRFTSPANLKQRRVGLTATVLMFAVMLVPVPYKVKATCEIQPVQRRVISAALDGPLQSVQVRPGDHVQTGDIMATIDPREVDFQLAALDAELRGAVSEQKGLMALHDVGGGEIAGLEAKRLRFQQELLSHRRKNLEIRAPLSGMVVAGDLRPAVGSLIEKGDPLFEVAPLEKMVVEIAIPESDFVHVRRDMPATIRLDAIPTQVFHGNIRYVYPSAELIDGDNVFIAEVSLSNPDGVLRPGMRGRVRIASDRHTMAWNLFHRAYHAVRATMGW
jgi:RND family efflux transporter MFP subunit